MKNDNIALQAKLFLYHLNNSNHENGIRKDECWTLKQVDERGKTEIERAYNPTVLAMVEPKALRDLSLSVMIYLNTQPGLRLLNASIEEVPGASYLIAFVATRPIR